MPTSVWPFDTYKTTKTPIPQRQPGSFTCFLICPFQPESRWDDFFELVKAVTTQVGMGVGVQINCVRADSLATAGVIHSEIWESIRQSDFIICDVTGQNGNVMFELGIASAWREKEQVIIVRDHADDKPRLFDIHPARHLEYDLSFSGMQKLMADLGKVLTEAFSAVPYEATAQQPVKLPFRANLENGVDSSGLYTEAVTHRRMLPDCLEFGSPFVYRHSWMSVGDLSLSKVTVSADLKLTLEHPKNESFLGLMVRGQSFYANLGHLVLVRKDGTVYVTVTEMDMQHHDELLGQLPNFDIHEFTHFKVSIDDSAISIDVGSLSAKKPLTQFPHVFSGGRVLFIAGLCRLGVRRVSVTSP